MLSENFGLTANSSPPPGAFINADREKDKAAAPKYVVMDGYLFDLSSGRKFPLKKLTYMRTDPASPEFELTPIDIALLDDDPDLALKLTEEILALDPDNVSALIDKGRALSMKDDVKGALAMIERALQIEPDNTAALYNKSLALWRLEDTPQALKFMEKSIRQDPDYIPGYRTRGCMLQEMGRIDEALDAFETALTMNNFGFLAPYQRQETAESLGFNSASEALENIRQCRAHRRNPSAHDSLS